MTVKRTFRQKNRFAGVSLLLVLCAQATPSPVYASDPVPNPVPTKTDATESAIPRACAMDDGSAYPMQPGSWGYTLNFEVTDGATGQPVGCLILNTLQEERIYLPEMCSVTGSIALVNGTATLQPGSFVACPFDLEAAVTSTNLPQADARHIINTLNGNVDFWMHARLGEAVSHDEPQSLIQHDKFELNVTVAGDKAHMYSRAFGNQTQSNLNMQTFAASAVTLISACQRDNRGCELNHLANWRPQSALYANAQAGNLSLGSFIFFGGGLRAESYLGPIHEIEIDPSCCW